MLDAITKELNAENRPFVGLSERLLSGEIFLLRNGFQQIGVFEKLQETSFSGIASALGEAVANRVRQVGFENIHTVVSASDIPKVADAVYEKVTPRSKEFLQTFVTDALGLNGHFYFERKPNVRFHIPYDVAAAETGNYKKFAERRGDGKITPHNPHRDSWVDCPSNLINVWVAVGPVKKGNSVTIYPDSYRRDVRKEGPYLAADESPGPAVTFDMNPGDALLFHGDHLHGSEINSTDSTRHVISFRIVLEKPHYAYGHYHHYLHSALAGGPLDVFAEVPQNMAWSFVRHRVGRAYELVSRAISGSASKSIEPTEKLAAEAASANGDTLEIPLAQLAPGSLTAVSDRICVARLPSGEVRAFSRYCTHLGADLTLGALGQSQIICPWHNLPFDVESGSNPCRALKNLKVYSCEIVDERVVIHPNTRP